jgi:hypothetical protein
VLQVTIHDDLDFPKNSLRFPLSETSLLNREGRASRGITGRQGEEIHVEELTWK